MVLTRPLWRGGRPSRVIAGPADGSEEPRRGGETVGVAPSPPPPSAAAASTHGSLSTGDRHRLLLDRCSTTIIMLFQLLNVVSHWGEVQTERARLYTLLVLAAATLGAASTVALPARFYLRHRLLLVPAQRALLLASPSIRQTGVGTSLLLERQPEEGVRGVLRQLLAIASGTKLILPIIQRFSIEVSPVATLVWHSAMVALAGGPSRYCDTPMMRHPLTLERMHRLAAALDWGTLPMLAFQSVVVGPALTAIDVRVTGEETLCKACLTFGAVWMAVVLPVLLAAFNYRPPNGQQNAGAAASPQHSSRFRRQLRRVAGAVAAADECIAQALGSRSFRFQRALLCWWALSYCWQWSKILAGMPTLRR